MRSHHHHHQSPNQWNGWFASSSCSSLSSPASSASTSSSNGFPFSKAPSSYKHFNILVPGFLGEGVRRLAKCREDASPYNTPTWLCLVMRPPCDHLRPRCEPAVLAVLPSHNMKCTGSLVMVWAPLISPGPASFRLRIPLQIYDNICQSRRSLLFLFLVAHGHNITLQWS